MNSLIKELQIWQITPVYNFGRAKLTGGDNTAREHYTRVLAENPELEVQLILDMARHDRKILELIEERAAIRCAENLLGDLKSAVISNFT